MSPDAPYKVVKKIITLKNTLIALSQSNVKEKWRMRGQVAHSNFCFFSRHGPCKISAGVNNKVKQTVP